MHAVHVYVQLYLLVRISTRSISSTIEKKSWASQWYQECHQMSQDDWYMDDEVFSRIWVMSSFNLGQICNTQNSAMALNPEDGNYHRRDPAESWHSSTRKAFKLSTCAMFPSPIPRLGALDLEPLKKPKITRTKSQQAIEATKIKGSCQSPRGRRRIDN